MFDEFWVNFVVVQLYGEQFISVDANNCQNHVNQMQWWKSKIVLANTDNTKVKLTTCERFIIYACLSRNAAGSS